jgi:DNA-binding transcriptional ArsR family regulator
MSDRIVELVRQHSKATKTAKFVLLVYAFYAQDNGADACPSPIRVAEEIGITPRAVYQHLKELEEMGEIRHDGKSPIYKTPTYTVLPKISQNALPASQTEKPASIDSVCLSVPESTPSVV